MSFFFDVWTVDGFIIASDVILLENGKQRYLRKLAYTSQHSELTCAIAVCGDYPERCLNFFTHAVSIKDTLRDVAYCFAEKWTEAYAGTEDYSAVHIVGYEKIPNSDDLVPQMWFWTTRNARGKYVSEEELQRNLKTFSNPIPQDNHIPWKIKQLTGQFPGSTLEEENRLVREFLQKHQPYFTWNGDPKFWKNAADYIGSALQFSRLD